MSQLLQCGAKSIAADVTLVTTTETIVLTSDAMPLPFITGKALIEAILSIIPGADVTGVNIRIRRGTLVTSPVVGPVWTHGGGLGAGAQTTFLAGVTDFLENVALAQYVVTAQQVAATANGAVKAAYLRTDLITG